jgi:hypothetical protein
VPADVIVNPDDLAPVVDSVGNGALCAQGIIEGGVVAAAVKEAVGAAAVGVISNELAGVVDAYGIGDCRTGRIDCGVGAAALDEPLIKCLAAGGVIPDDLAGVVDGLGDGVSRTGNIDCGVGAAAALDACKLP